MPEDVSIKVEGLADLKKALKDLEGKVPKDLAAGLKQIAGQVAADVQGKVETVSGRARQSVKASGTQKGASIKAGGDKAPYYQWLDFGGSVGRGHIERQSMSGAIKRPFITGGRYIYPAISARHEDTVRAVDQLVTALAERAGFDVKGDL